MLYFGDSTYFPHSFLHTLQYLAGLHIHLWLRKSHSGRSRLLLVCSSYPSSTPRWRTRTSRWLTLTQLLPSLGLSGCWLCYGLKDRGIKVRFPVWPRLLSSLGSEAHSACNSTGTWSSSSWQREPRSKPDYTHLHLGPKLIMCRATYLLLSMTSGANTTGGQYIVDIENILCLCRETNPSFYVVQCARPSYSDVTMKTNSHHNL